MAKSKKATKVKDPTAKFYTVTETSSWQPIPKNFGGTKQDVLDNKFIYPDNISRTGLILFDDATVYDSAHRSDRNVNDSDILLKTLVKQQSLAEKQKRDAEKEAKENQNNKDGE